MLIAKTLITFVCLISGSNQFESIAGKTVLDLSYNLSNETLRWIKFPPLELKMIHKGIFNKGSSHMWVQQDEIRYNTHIGTHIDAPCHFARDGWCLSDIPLENFIDRPIAMVDVTQQAAAIRDYEASVDDIKQWETANGRIPDRAVLIVRTGWARFWPKKLEYFGTDTNDTDLVHFPGVHPDAAQWLADNRNIVGLGIDGPSTDHGITKEFKTHQILAKKNVYNIENIASTVDQLPAVGAKLLTLPLKVEGASGTPVTVIAYFDANGVHAAINISPSVGVNFILVMSCVLLFKLCVF